MTNYEKRVIAYWSKTSFSFGCLSQGFDVDHSEENLEHMVEASYSFVMTVCDFKKIFHHGTTDGNNSTWNYR